MIYRPKFTDLTPERQLNFGNGLGPYWFPDEVRKFITTKATWFFKSASWRHHDFGYVVGGDRWDRARCDWKFFAAMMCDAVDQKRYKIIAIPFATLVSIVCYLLVRIGGHFSSFEYRSGYADLDEIADVYRGP